MRHLLNKIVEVRSNRTGALYIGKLAGFRPNKFCITQLTIVNWAGGTTTSKTKTSRWFANDRFTINELKLTQFHDDSPQTKED